MTRATLGSLLTRLACLGIRPQIGSCITPIPRWGIVNAIVTKTTSGAVESIDARIQKIKKMACGYRNVERFRRAILFHLGCLDLYPTLTPTHTTS